MNLQQPPSDALANAAGLDSSPVKSPGTETPPAGALPDGSPGLVPDAAPGTLTDGSTGLPNETSPGLSFDDLLQTPRRHSGWRRVSAAVAVIAAVGLVGALVMVATGHGPGSNDGVATLKNSGATASAGPSAAGSQDPYQAMLAYAGCMRSHGIADFPDPNTNGGLQIQGGGDLDPNSTLFQAAQQACQSLMPGAGNGQFTTTQGGGGPGLSMQMGGSDSAQAQQQMLAFSQCMRSNGVPGFPDPVVSNGSVSIQVPSDLDPNSPAFKAAQQKCMSLIAVPGATQVTTGGGQ